MVNAGLGFNPKWSSIRSEISGGDRQVAAVVALRIAAHSQTAAESERKVSACIEARQSGKVAGDVVECDFSPTQRMEYDPLRQVDPDCPDRVPLNGVPSEHR